MGKLGQTITIELSQADRVIEKFGGVSAMLRALKDAGYPKALSTVYRWTYSKEKGGTGGVIPKESMLEILAAARFTGVFLSNEDLDPRPSKRQTRKWEELLDVRGPQ